jgi:hypothetical protein
MTAGGVLHVHSAPTEVCPHVEWALTRILGVPVALDWIPQPVAPGTHRTALRWQGSPGTSGRLVSALRGWRWLRFEVTEEATRGSDRMRYSYTPTLGVHSCTLSASGDVLVSEARLRRVVSLAAGGQYDLDQELDALLGRPWDEELAPFRNPDTDTPVRRLESAG